MRSGPARYNEWRLVIEDQGAGGAFFRRMEMEELVFSVCVSKPLSLNKLKGIIHQFIHQKLSFGLLRGHEWGSYVIWREALPDESIRKKSDALKAAIVEPNPPPINSFTVIYAKGEMIKDERKIFPRTIYIQK